MDTTPARTPAKKHRFMRVKIVFFPERGNDQEIREAESSSRPMSPIISRRAARESSEDIIEERSAGVYSVFFMAGLIYLFFLLFLRSQR